ncbi:AAA family ATPase [Patescibacteria group bacterium]|nr:AAA family ATPase [Patescibacteria group bacterium]MBU4017213.1 AAA family ATPase [Patescibacteria group bacterium]
MIIKISKLRNFGIFHEFSWKTELPEFKKFNLIYGWNRSGKTTASRVFASCEKKCVYDKDKFNQYPENGEFEIKTSDNGTIKNTDTITNTLPIKVFNEDFIVDNISFDPLDSCNPIIYVSEEDIESKKQLEQLKADKITLGKALEEAKKNKATKEEAKSSFLTGLGREIANMLFDKNYNKTKVEAKINSIGVDKFTDKILSDEDKKKNETISKSEAEKDQLTLSKLPLVNFNFLFTRVKSLLDKKVVSELLQRLKDPEDVDGGLDEELNNWVKQGFDIHKSKNQFKKCLFCENDLDSNLFDSLARHFSKDYEDLQSSIKRLIESLKKEKLTNIPEKNVELYPDLRNDYEAKAKRYNEIIKKQNDWLWQSEMWLEQKYKNPFDPDIPEMVKAPENYNDLLNEIIDELNKIILNHNQRAKNHATEVLKTREKLELHSIAVALSEQDYKKLESDLKGSEIKEKEVLGVVNKNNTDISELEKKNSNIGKAIEKINKHLKEFFGREEIKLELDGDKKGYIIKRDGQPAKNLSEGEKTAIAFSYFIVKVEEKEFKIKDGIIFIDDPISSFDSNFIYHCFSLISTHFKEAGQLFISTHNFQLFNLVKEWFINKNNHVRNKANEKPKTSGQVDKPMPCEFFMVENFTELDVRKAKIVELDKTLRNYKSEYHFLFAKLKEFSEKQDTQYEDFYTIGNMARRFFDIFADFKIPDSRHQKQKMEAIINELNEGKKENEKISASDWNKAYKLVNEFSHNSDPTSTIEHKDKSESKDAIKILLNIVKESDPKHYEILLKNTI